MPPKASGRIGLAYRYDELTDAPNRALRAARSIDGPPPRVDDGRGERCDYQTDCGTERRSLRSLVG